MVSPWWLIYGCVAGYAVVQAALLTLHAWEQRRFTRSRLAKPEAPRQAWPVVLTVPLKGLDLGLEANLRRFFAQDYRPLELRFVVEAIDDPAATLVDRLMAEYPQVRASRVVAGRATQEGQKVHNLRLATADLPRACRALAFADSDARPDPAWLSRLIGRLERSPGGAVTGYRWFVPESPTAPNLVLAAVNAAVAGLFGSGGRHLVWGGAWCLTRECFETIGLRAAWAGTLSDDLVASRVLRAAGRRVEFEPSAMVVSPLDTTWAGLGEFLRRQYLIGRAYVPRWWLSALVVISLAQVAYWTSLGWALGLVLGQGDWLTVPAAVWLWLQGHLSIRAAWRQTLGRAYAGSPTGAARWAGRLDLGLGAVVGLANWMGLLASLGRREIVWRGIRYRLAPGGRVLSVERPSASPSHSSEGPSAGPHFASRRPTSSEPGRSLAGPTHDHR